MRLTEQPSLYDDLEKKSVAELLRDINEEDKKVPLAIEKVLPDLTRLISAIEHQLRNGGCSIWAAVREDASRCSTPSNSRTPTALIRR